jgi:hypothetical protein
MPVQHLNPVIEKQARLLAEENRKADLDIGRVFWFPDESEVRLVELSEQMPASADGELHPFHFRAAPQDDLPAPSGVAIIRPDELNRLKLPARWGSWSDALEV